MIKLFKNKLKNISSAKINRPTRTLATIVAVLIGINNTGIYFAKSFQNTAETNTSASEKIKKVIKNNKKIITVGGIMVVAAIASKIIIDRLKTSCTDELNPLSDDTLNPLPDDILNPSPDDILKFYLTKHKEISFEEWFRTLGGTDEDISSYLEQLQARPNLSQLTTGQCEIIDSDLNRSINEDRIINGEVGMAREVLSRILKIGDSTGDVSYTQGYDRYAALALNKFLQYNQYPTPADEAKIYYVYKTIVQSSAAFAYDLGGGSEKISNSLFGLTRKTLQSMRLKESNFLYLMRDEWYTSAVLLLPPMTISGADWFENEQLIKIWDNIILNRSMANYGTFDSKIALRQLAFINNAVLFKYIDDNNLGHINDVNVAFKEIGGNLNSKMRNYCKSLAY